MEKRILVHVEEDETTIAILEDRELVELYIEREDEQSIVGNIYKGKVTNVLAGMQSAFVDVGLEKDVFLHIGDIEGLEGDEEEGGLEVEIEPISIADVLEVGQEIIVQIMKDPIGTKGARGTTYITLPGRYTVLLPNERHIGISRRITDEAERERLKKIGEALCPEDMGVILRTVAEHKSAEEIAQDINFLHQLWKKIQHRIAKSGLYSLIHNELSIVLKIARDLFTPDVSEIVIDSKNEYERILEFFDFMMPQYKQRVKLYKDDVGLFEKNGIDRAIDRLMQNRVWLNCGGYIIIQKTEALTAIDVNTGKYTGETTLEETVFRTNLEAAVEIAKQIRLRDIGGIIIIDFIDMEEQAHRDKVMEVLKQAMEKDRSKSSIIGITEFGLVEITRKRVGKSINELLQQNCPYCKGTGRVLSSRVIANKARREILKLSAMTPSDTILVSVHPDVALQLMGEDDEKLRELENRTKKLIYVKPQEDFHIEQIQISAK